MPLRRPPRAPHPDLYLTLGTRTIPPSWHPYLPQRALAFAEDTTELPFAA
jgi:hypothetical protein